MLTKLARNAELKDKNQCTVNTAAMRITKDLANLDGTSVAFTQKPDPSNLQKLLVTVKPPDGLWAGGTFHFRIDFPNSYPHDPPKATYLGPQRLWHPNIEGDADRTEWGVCLNILRKDWKPVLGTRDIFFGLEMLFFEPNIDDPLPGTARQAATHLRDDPKGFGKKAQQWVKGNYV